MPKRWFDLLATILTVPYIFISGGSLFGFFGDIYEYDPRAWGVLIAYAFLVIAFRRFFYNKEK